MRASPFILRTTLALSLALLFSPDALNAQSSNAQLGGQTCTTGNGLYSCDFKDATGAGNFQADVTLSPGQLILSPDSDKPFPEATLTCVCGLASSVKKKQTSAVICKDPGDDLALTGVVSGNPSNPSTFRFVGLLLNFNLSKGYLFDCDHEE
jgi:hypothetical protein